MHVPGRSQLLMETPTPTAVVAHLHPRLPARSPSATVASYVRLTSPPEGPQGQRPRREFLLTLRSTATQVFHHLLPCRSAWKMRPNDNINYIAQINGSVPASLGSRF